MNSSAIDSAARSAFLKEMGITEWSDRTVLQPASPELIQAESGQPAQVAAPSMTSGSTSLSWVFIGTKPQGDALTLFQNMVRALGLSNRAWVWKEAKASLDSLAPISETPLVALAFGAATAQRLTGENTPLAELRGAIHALQIQGDEIPLIATLELAQLLARPADKALLWEDLLLARSVLQSL